LGKSGIEVSALGLGCWPIGGLFYLDGKPDGYGNIDDNESIKAIQKGIDLGINFFDTADVYGAGHNEIVLGKAIKGKREKVIIATKFGYTFDEKSKYVTGNNSSAEYLKHACRDSLKRLDTDYIDLYQLHLWLSNEEAAQVVEALEELKKQGLIREYGWSTDLIENFDFMHTYTNGVSIQHEFNIFKHMDEMLYKCENHNIASINRSPLAMGLLSGKYNENSMLPEDDVRGNSFDWVIYYKNGKPAAGFLKKLDAIREILSSKGRSLVQGALAWIWAKSESNIPIPGFKNVKQVEENAKAMEFGPLTKKQLDEIQKLLTQ
jgi:aryl-alcohol dehydrogenase-like predicted oxidoreductase